MADGIKAGEVYVELKAKTDQLEAELNRLKSHINKETANIGKEGGSKLSGGFASALKLGGAAIGIKALFDVLKASVREARDAAIAYAQISQAIKTTGGAAGFTAPELVKIANGLEQITATDADEILHKVTLQLLTFTNIAGDAFKRAQTAALDLSAVLGSDLQGQTIQLAKALEDPLRGITALSRAGVTFTEKQKETIKTLVESGDLFKAQGVILDEIEAKYGGQARILAEADGGYKKLNITIKNLEQSIGEDLIGSATQGAGAITELADAFDYLNTATKNATGGVGIIGSAINAVKILVTGGFSQGDDIFSQLAQQAKIKYLKEVQESIKKTKEFLSLVVKPPTKLTPVTPILSTQTGDEILAQLSDEKKKRSEIINLINQKKLLEQTPTVKEEIKALQDALDVIDKTNDKLKQQQDIIEEHKKVYDNFYTAIGLKSENYYQFRIKQLNDEVKKLKDAKVAELDIEKWYNEQLKQLELDRIRAAADATLKELQTASNNKRAGLIQTPNGKIIGETTAQQNLQTGAQQLANTMQPVSTEDLVDSAKQFSEYLKQSEESAKRIEESANQALGGANQIANALNIGANTFVGILLDGLNRAVDLASGIINIISGITSLVNPAAGIASMAAHSGGTFMNGKKIAGYASGGSFIVPNGFPNDSFPLLVESGERVTVTPSNAVGNQEKLLAQLIGSVNALNKNLINKNLTSVSNVNIDGKQITKQVVSNQNKLGRDKVNLNYL